MSSESSRRRSRLQPRTWSQNVIGGKSSAQRRTAAAYRGSSDMKVTNDCCTARSRHRSYLISDGDPVSGADPGCFYYHGL